MSIYNETYKDWSGYEEGTYYKWRSDMPTFTNVLMDAVNDSDHETVKAILEKHRGEVDWMVRDSQWHSMLNIAVKRNDAAMAQLLLDFGAPIEWSGSECMARLRPLANAIWWRHNGIANLLINNGADIDGDGPKFGTDESAGWCGSPVTIAFCRNNMEMLHRLLSAGAKSDIRTSSGEVVDIVPLRNESLVEAYKRLHAQYKLNE